MPRIEIGAGFVVAVLAAFGALGEIPVAIVLLAVGVFLIVHGAYDELIKPRVQVDKRIADWLQRRDWSVRIESEPQFSFVLHAQDEDNRQVTITRTKKARNNVLAFTSKVGLDPAWLAALEKMELNERQKLLADMRILFAIKSVGFTFVTFWPPNVVIQDALSLDNQLSQHLVDIRAKNIVHTYIGVRSLIRRAIAESGSPSPVTDDSTPTPSPESAPDTASPQPQ